jgi:hypothetical protein
MAKKLALLGLVLLGIDVVGIGVWSVSRTGHPPAASAVRLPAAPSTSAHLDGKRVVPATLALRIVRLYSARRIENAYLPAHAKGVYVIMDVAATNGTTANLPLASALIRLVIDQSSYPPSSDGVAGLELSGHKTLASTELPPATTVSRWIAFDIPVSELASPTSLCYGQRACVPVRAA